jgi:N-methylhydantoinase B
MNPIELNLFSSRLESICEQMGEVLRNAAFSPNIRDRLDFSCAVFDYQGELSAQAAHIPVHLGSMAFAMSSVIEKVEWSEGDQVIFNDPFLGGTHLPDVTMVAPVFVEGELTAFVVNRAHHADIGSDSPGSMPVSTSLELEGLVISPQHFYKANQPNRELQEKLAGRLTGDDTAGDFAAQFSANRFGVSALSALIENMSRQMFLEGLQALNEYAAMLSRQSLEKIPDGSYEFEDLMDDDGQANQAIKIFLKLDICNAEVVADFSGTADQVPGNINCPLSVAAAAVFYVFRCLMPAQTPACAGAFQTIKIAAPEGSLVNARFPAAVAAGNVETSTRIVDVTLGALAKAIPDKVPAASHGSMNNVAMGQSGASGWNYYETIGGGMGAHHLSDGLSAVQTHMTNTLNTPVEVLELKYPLRIMQYAIRKNSGGTGTHNGGNGIVRAYQFTQSAQMAVLTERRHFAPWGFAGGQDGHVGKNLLNGKLMPAKFQCQVQSGDLLEIRTPGGGGFGQ